VLPSGDALDSIVCAIQPSVGQRLAADQQGFVKAEKKVKTFLKNHFGI
jgi:hypothetical protein